MGQRQSSVFLPAQGTDISSAVLRSSAVAGGESPRGDPADHRAHRCRQARGHRLPQDKEHHLPGLRRDDPFQGTQPCIVLMAMLMSEYNKHYHQVHWTAWPMVRHRSWLFPIGWIKCHVMPRRDYISLE